MDKQPKEQNSESVPALPEGDKPAINRPVCVSRSKKLRDILFYRWKPALAAGLLLAVVGAGLAWLTYTPKFTAVALIRMASSRPRLFSDAQSDEGVLNREEQFQKRQVQLLKTNAILEKT